MKTLFTMTVASLLAVGAQSCGHCGHSDKTHAGANGTSAAMNSDPATAAKTEVAAPTSLTGTLQSIPNAQDQTRWALIGDGSAGAMRVDISRVRDVVTGLDGKRVKVKGHMVATPADGKPTIIADSIMPAE